jgi:hypothetical protein
VVVVKWRRLLRPLLKRLALSGRGGAMYARPENCPSAAQLPRTYVVQLKLSFGAKCSCLPEVDVVLKGQQAFPALPTGYTDKYDVERNARCRT